MIENYTLLMPLTKKENQVLSLASKGYTNQEILNYLGITIATLKSHFHKIYAKFGIDYAGNDANCCKRTIAVLAWLNCKGVLLYPTTPF